MSRKTISWREFQCIAAPERILPNERLDLPGESGCEHVRVRRPCVAARAM